MGFLAHLFGTPGPILRGERLLLRAPQRGDYPAWSTLRAESRGFLAPWEPTWAADELSWKNYILRLQRYRDEARERSAHTFFLFEGDGGALVGGLTLGQIRRGVSQSAMLGYWMGERFAGAGRMREAVGLVADFAFDVERLHRLEAACLPSNRRSTQLLQRSGFRLEGRLRHYLKIAGRWEDHDLYALLAEDRMTTRQRPASTGLAAA